MKSLPLRVILLFLMLFGNSNSLFSANEISDAVNNGEQQELTEGSLVGEQVDSLFDSALPAQKAPLFFKIFHGDFHFEASNSAHTSSSVNYIKRSRYLFPAFGPKELIFPFHVFF